MTDSKFSIVGDGLVLHYHEAGSGAPLVLLHGAGPGASGLSNYQGNYGYFVEHGYRVLMPDLIGFGKSSKPIGVPYDFDLLAGSLRMWLHSLGLDECSLVGNSMGGAVAIRLAIDHPELIKNLVLLAPTALAETESYTDMPGIRALFATVMGERPLTFSAMRNLFENMYFNLEDIDDRIVAERTMVANEQPDDVYKNLALRSLKDELGEIQCPVLMLWGLNDKFCPLVTSNNLLVACSRSRLITISGCGHWVQVEKRDIFNRMTVDFLQNG